MNTCCGTCDVGSNPTYCEGFCPCHQEKPTHEMGWEEKIDLIWSRAHIPEFANDARTVLKRLFKQTLTHQKESIVSKLEGMELVEANQLRKSAFGLVEGDAPIFKSAYNAALEDIIDVVRDIDL